MLLRHAAHDEILFERRTVFPYQQPVTVVDGRMLGASILGQRQPTGIQDDAPARAIVRNYR